MLTKVPGSWEILESKIRLILRKLDLEKSPNLESLLTPRMSHPGHPC